MLRENAWKKYDSEKLQEMNSFCDKYKNFISECKTERECVTFAVEEIKKAGYVDLNEVISSGRELKSQDKVYVKDVYKRQGLTGKLTLNTTAAEVPSRAFAGAGFTGELCLLYTSRCV